MEVLRRLNRAASSELAITDLGFLPFLEIRF